jgi:hypothetical protein
MLFYAHILQDYVKWRQNVLPLTRTNWKGLRERGFSDVM